MALESGALGSLGYPRPKELLFCCAHSDDMPTLWPGLVALPLNCLRVLRLHPQEPLPRPHAALLGLV